MRARDAVGKRVVAVHQSRHYDPQFGHVVVALDSIELEDGTRIVVYAHDDATDCYVTADTIRVNPLTPSRNHG